MIEVMARKEEAAYGLVAYAAAATGGGVHSISPITFNVKKCKSFSLSNGTFTPVFIQDRVLLSASQ